MSRVTARRRVLRIRDGAASQRPDTLAAEEPMEIRLDGRPLTVTMRTPGSDFDLAAGFLLSEGVVRQSADIAAIRYCAGATGDGGNTYNVVDVALAPGVAVPDQSLERNFYTTSSCGLCGKASLDAVRTTAPWTVAEDPLHVEPETLTALPDRLRTAQRVFARTGGLHAAGLFTADGELLCLREDVGRHNAVDKVIGHSLRSGWLPLRGTILLVSGRASFELVQKAVMAGIPMLAAVSAPSSLAVELAEDRGLTLVGFLRGTSMNVYTRADRVQFDLPVVGGSTVSRHAAVTPEEVPASA
ncbi:formate dehydrogenase accessory sulfurtransferase FdhD [Saccharopolyspora thermophila]|uniref:Sulfur carrier protein FdhD n=1 Tax=Saccharopolyspora thermophila TaxID=89367 RepID=A0ABN1CVG2_9PSEU